MRLVCLVLLLPSLCFAWGGEGHQIVALIAEKQLTPATQALVKDLLGDAHISDAEVASWADEYRREHRETSGWHFVNVPADAATFDRNRDGRDGMNVIDKLTEQANLLADKSHPREKRIEALKWVVHLAGDIHQPLHVADRNGDKGGNARLVFFEERREAVSLHFVWDTLILRESIGRQRIATYADALERQITPAQRKEWGAGNPERWANETHAVAVKVYADVPAVGPPPKLVKDYTEKNSPVVQEQLRRAGVRLATLLNTAAR